MKVVWWIVFRYKFNLTDIYFLLYISNLRLWAHEPILKNHHMLLFIQLFNMYYVFLVIIFDKEITKKDIPSFRLFLNAVWEKSHKIKVQFIVTKGYNDLENVMSKCKLFSPYSVTTVITNSYNQELSKSKHYYVNSPFTLPVSNCNVTIWWNINDIIKYLMVDKNLLSKINYETIFIYSYTSCSSDTWLSPLIILVIFVFSVFFWKTKMEIHGRIFPCNK